MRSLISVTLAALPDCVLEISRHHKICTQRSLCDLSVGKELWSPASHITLCACTSRSKVVIKQHTQPEVQGAIDDLLTHGSLCGLLKVDLEIALLLIVVVGEVGELVPPLPLLQTIPMRLSRFMPEWLRLQEVTYFGHEGILCTYPTSDCECLTLAKQHRDLPSRSVALITTIIPWKLLSNSEDVLLTPKSSGKEDFLQELHTRNETFAKKYLLLFFGKCCFFIEGVHSFPFHYSSSTCATLVASGRKLLRTFLSCTIC